MNGRLAGWIDEVIIAAAVSRGVETVTPLRPATTGSLVPSAPVADVRLPPCRPLRKVELRFDSAVKVGDGSGDVATGLLVASTGTPTRGVLLVPGWLGRFRPWFWWLARRLARRGCVVAMLDLPAHAARTPPGARHGARLLAGDPTLTDLYLAQAVSDARGLLRAVRREAPTAPPVAVGFSLGGWVAGTVAGLEPGAAALLCTPAADPGSLLGSSPLLASVREELVASGQSVEAVALRAGELALGRRACPTGGALLLAGEFDRVIPVDVVRNLGEAWGAPVEILPVGHMTPYVSPAFVRRIERVIAG